MKLLQHHRLQVKFRECGKAKVFCEDDEHTQERRQSRWTELSDFHIKNWVGFADASSSFEWMYFNG
jgi:hypothetical protein